MATRTGLIHVDALITGYELTNTTLLYYLSNAGSSAWTATEANAFELATQTWEAVANIDFQRTFSFASSHLAEYKYVSIPEDQGAHEQYVGSQGFQLDPVFIDSRFDVLNGEFNQNGIGWTNAGLARGGTGFVTIVHEIGHAIGLDHPHQDEQTDAYVFPGVSDPFDDAGENGLNTQLYTLMSYREDAPISTVHDYGKAGGPMAFDIAAAQAIYGANMSYNTGNDYYYLPSHNGAGTYYTAIWDAGGTDTIVHTGTQNVAIDLRPATLQNEAGGGGFLSRADGIFGGFTIANGVIIETAIGNVGDDYIVGNEAANTLAGRSGSDTIGGQGGDDYLYGEEGFDWLWGGLGNDTLGGGDNDDTLRGEGGNDWLYGNEGGDTLNGNEGNDVLFGGGYGINLLGGDAGFDWLEGGFNSDYMWGGTQGDRFIFGGYAWHDFIMDFEDGTDVIDLSAWGYTAASQISMVDDSGGNAFLSLGYNTWISVIGVSSAQLTDADFVFG